MRSRVIANVERLIVLLREKVLRVMGRKVVQLHCEESGSDYRVWPSSVDVIVYGLEQSVRVTCPLCSRTHVIEVPAAVAHLVLDAGALLVVDIPGDASEA